MKDLKKGSRIETIYINFIFCLLILPTTDHLRNLWSPLSRKEKIFPFFGILLSKCPVVFLILFFFLTQTHREWETSVLSCVHPCWKAWLYMCNIWEIAALQGWMVSPFPISPPLQPLVYDLLRTQKILEIAQLKLPLLIQTSNSTMMTP